MSFFLWGLTPIVSELVGRICFHLRLLPHLSQKRHLPVHADRPSCEHSLSLTLDYSDEVGLELIRPRPRTASAGDGFGTHEHGSVSMEVGDAVLYQGVRFAHGRTRPNPNGWSAHLFLHYVDRNGPYADHAFDRQLQPGRVSFSFA